MAIALHFDDSHASTIPEAPVQIPPTRPAAPQTSTSRSSGSLMEELHRPATEGIVYPPASSRPVSYNVQEGSALSFVQTLLFYPFTVGYKLFNGLFYFLSTLFPFLPRLTGYYPANRTATRSVQRTDAKTTAVRIIRAFEETYGEIGLKFFEGGFTQAFELAKSQFKFLVVIIQSDEHDLTGPFNRQVLTDARVVELLNRDDVILWLGNVQNSEGLQVADALRCTLFPFTQLIAPFPRSPTSFAIIMKTLATIQGETDPMKFISTLEEKMEAHSPTIMSLVLDRQERERDRQLRDEQNAAYERSLAADKERERLAREEALRKDQEESERKAREEKETLEKERAALEQKRIEEEKQRNIMAWKLWRISQLGPEFDGSTERPARISVRMLSGDRIVRKFSANQTIEDIYAFVECYDLLGDPSIFASASTEPPTGYIHKYEFELASTLPRQVLLPDANAKIGDNKSVWPSASLVVEVNDYEEDDDIE